MTIALAMFSALIIAMSMYGVVQPLKLTELVRRFMISPGVWGAVAIRLLLAGLLWLTAEASHTPITFKVLALLTLLAAIALPMIGAARIMKFIDYLAAWPPIAIRIQCLLGVILGAFLLWSLSTGLTKLMAAMAQIADDPTAALESNVDPFRPQRSRRQVA